MIFGYNGRDGVITEDTGLLYMRARYYCPDLRRFVNADIIAGDITNAITLNRYAYANGNPVSNIDPFGLSAERGDSVSIEEHKMYAQLAKDWVSWLIYYASMTYYMSGELKQSIPIAPGISAYYALSVGVGEGPFAISSSAVDNLDVAYSLIGSLSFEDFDVSISDGRIVSVSSTYSSVENNTEMVLSVSFDLIENSVNLDYTVETKMKTESPKAPYTLSTSVGIDATSVDLYTPPVITTKEVTVQESVPSFGKQFAAGFFLGVAIIGLSTLTLYTLVEDFLTGGAGVANDQDVVEYWKQVGELVKTVS